ncbi:vacuolar protein sorting-associated protein 53 homolog isoform X2 [Macrobrachium nipponense]|uniref:vacuolar protein sorting-associated protein 53 homolog isoform X2 n=1 Tax=Macrobrachium nipponense TaxID=159736 RepID=UPI0030C809E7
MLISVIASVHDVPNSAEFAMNRLTLYAKVTHPNNNTSVQSDRTLWLLTGTDRQTDRRIRATERPFEVLMMEPDTMTDVEKLNLDFPPEVVQAIQEILPSDDPFDAPEFNTVEYINTRFPAEQSLHHIDDVLEEMRLRITSTDDQIRTVVRSLTNVDQDGRASLLNAQEAIAELFTRFQDIKERAGESEQRVKEITRDIKQLDTAKRNLTTSITTLNHLQMLVEGVQKLEALKVRREYGEIASLLQGVMNVLEHLNRYRHIPQVADLARQVDQIRGELEKQILEDFHRAFHGPNARRFTPTKELAEACLVVSELDPKVKRTIIEDVIKTQLAEYEVLFAGGESDAWLTKVDLRRKWLLKTAVEFEKTLAAMFPPSWQVPARLALSFCEVTRSQLSHAMELRSQDIDVGTLLHAHKVMSELESLLIRKYAGFQPYDRTPRNSISTNPFIEDEKTESTNPFESEASGETPVSPFQGAVCRCFQPYLKVYIENVDKRLSEQIEKFANDMKNYKFEHIDAEESNVVPCCGELFTIYKTVLVEFLRLGPGESLGGLVEVFQKHLREFCTRVLRATLPRVGANIPMPKDINMKELTAVLAQVQTLWREGDSPKLVDDDVRRVCSVLVSAEYCEEMTGRLEAKLKERSPAPLANTISLTQEQDLFHAVLAQCIALLVTHVECLCEPALTSMTKVNWMMEQTGDQSPYVTAIAQHISSSVPLVRHNLHTSRKYFTRFCDKLAAAILNKFVQQVYKCRPISGVGCEQLLLDCHALKAVMLQLPVVNSQVRRDPPQTYTRMVGRGMARAELVLQVVMGEYATQGDLVDKFHRLLPDATIADFQKVLEMRGVKDRASVLELYRQRTMASVTESPLRNPATPSSGSQTPTVQPVINQASQVVNTIVSSSVQSPEHEMSKIARLERMLKSRRLIS